MVPEITVEWLDEAIQSYNRIADFVLHVWGPDMVEDFGKITHRKLEALKRNPELGSPVEEKPRLRQTIIHQNALLYYFYDPEQYLVELVSFWDPRENPAKKKFLY